MHLHSVSPPFYPATETRRWTQYTQLCLLSFAPTNFFQTVLHIEEMQKKVIYPEHSFISPCVRHTLYPSPLLLLMLMKMLIPDWTDTSTRAKIYPSHNPMVLFWTFPQKISLRKALVTLVIFFDKSTSESILWAMSTLKPPKIYKWTGPTSVQV